MTQDDKGELWAETTLTEELKNEPKSQMVSFINTFIRSDPVESN